MKVIFFRTNYTDMTKRQAADFGLIPIGAEVLTIASPDGAQAQPGDIEWGRFAWRHLGVSQDSPDNHEGEIVVIVNGGPCNITIRLTDKLAKLATRWDAERDERLRDLNAERARFSDRRWHWRFLELGRDGVEQLAGDQPTYTKLAIAS